jgi:hypothetical protein
MIQYYVDRIKKRDEKLSALKSNYQPHKHMEYQDRDPDIVKAEDDFRQACTHKYPFNSLMRDFIKTEEHTDVILELKRMGLVRGMDEVTILRPVGEPNSMEPYPEIQMFIQELEANREKIEMFNEVSSYDLVEGTEKLLDNLALIDEMQYLIVDAQELQHTIHRINQDLNDAKMNFGVNRGGYTDLSHTTTINMGHYDLSANTSLRLDHHHLDTNLTKKQIEAAVLLTAVDAPKLTHDPVKDLETIMYNQTYKETLSKMARHEVSGKTDIDMQAIRIASDLAHRYPNKSPEMMRAMVCTHTFKGQDATAFEHHARKYIPLDQEVHNPFESGKRMNPVESAHYMITGEHRRIREVPKVHAIDFNEAVKHAEAKMRREEELYKEEKKYPRDVPAARAQLFRKEEPKMQVHDLSKVISNYLYKGRGFGPER